MLKVLLSDPDKNISEHLTLLFRKEGFDVFTAVNGIQTIEMAKKHTLNLVLLEIIMPVDGVETCIELRKIEEFKKIPIIFYTDRAEEYSQIAAFNAGADDYILKSVKPGLLISRMKAILKRYGMMYDIFDGGNNSDENLKIDRERYLVLKNGKELTLPRKEFELLYLLSSDPRKTFTRQEIAKRIWGYDVFEKNRTIDVHIGRLREKIGLGYIKTVKGIGYRLEL